MKVSKAKPAADAKPQIDIAVPAFGYKSHFSINRRHGIALTPEDHPAETGAGASLWRSRADGATGGWRSASVSRSLPPVAATALGQIAGWFEDHIETHPHSGPRMRSPREFRRAHQPDEVFGQ